MNQSAVACREIFDENSQPSAEEVSEYAQQLGIDPDSESHLLPLAREGLMQALPHPWKAYYDEKLQAHYYFNIETKKTQWDHPLDKVYKELVKKARDASIHEDTCASVQELPTYEEGLKNLERLNTRVESDEDLTTDSEDDGSNVKETANKFNTKSMAPIGRPPLAPSSLEKKLGDTKTSPFRNSLDNSPKSLTKDKPEKAFVQSAYPRPRSLFKQNSEIIDLKMHMKDSFEDGNFRFLGMRPDKGLPLTGKGNIFLRASKSELPSPDTDKSLPLDSMTKSDPPPKGILREKLTTALQKKTDSIVLNGSKNTSSLEEDRKSVRFQLENVIEPTHSPGSNSSSEQNDESSIINAKQTPSKMDFIPSELEPVFPLTTHTQQSSLITPSLTKVPNPRIILSPIVKKFAVSSKSSDDLEKGNKEVGNANSNENCDISRETSPRRRVIHPPAADFIKPDLFLKDFKKISDLVRSSETMPIKTLEEPVVEKESRPRSPMIPQKSKISINLMESIESETSSESDKELVNFDLDEFNEHSKNNEFSKSNRSNGTQANVGSQLDFCKENKIVDNDLAEPTAKSKLDFLHVKNNGHAKIETVTSRFSNDPEIPLLRISPSSSISSGNKSPVSESLNKPSPTFKPLSRTNSPKSFESNSNFNNGLGSPRLDGVMLSQGKSSSDNVVVVYQFESQNDKTSPKPKSPIPESLTKNILDRQKFDERKRLELSLQKELEIMKSEWISRERKMKTDLQMELKIAEEKFQIEKKQKLDEQRERHSRELEHALAIGEKNHKQALQKALTELEENYTKEVERTKQQHANKMSTLFHQCQEELMEKMKQLEIENDKSLMEIKEQLQTSLNMGKSKLIEEHKNLLEALKEEHNKRVEEMKEDYRAEVDRLRSQHACHLEELRAKLAAARRAPPADAHLADKYRCLKEKYARLKHDVKMSIERRNKRREMSVTTGSETEKSNSNKIVQSLERCKEANETSSSTDRVSVRTLVNNNGAKAGDNDTSCSEGNAAGALENNNSDWARPKNHEATEVKSGRKTAVAFRDTPRARDRSETGPENSTDGQDSSDATTVDNKKESVIGHNRRKSFTRLKSASTSRLNYSPKCSDSWAAPLETLRQQLKKLDDLEEQFPDLAFQPAYRFRYPITELGSNASGAEVDFVRHRALVEREGVRRARAALSARTDHLAQEQSGRDASEIEVGIHRARALLAEKEIRLRHIERALRHITSKQERTSQEVSTSDCSSGSETVEASAVDEEVERRCPRDGGEAVLRSLRALHADVRDIWRALDGGRAPIRSQEVNSLNVPHSFVQPNSAPDQSLHDNSEGSVAERAKSLREWLNKA